MAKLPGYIVGRCHVGPGKQLVIRFHIRWWHPGLWWALCKTLMAREEKR